MTRAFSRRQFLAAALASPAAAAYTRSGSGQRRTSNPPGGQRRVAAAPPASPDPRLWLPATHGEGAGVAFTNAPDWLRDTPGWYVPSTVSAGACMLQFPEVTFLSTLIRSFRELPSLLDQAKSLGTRTIYIVDWFEGQPGARPINYWTNKGDYIPRADLGGDAALQAGIAAVHAAGGRIVLYVEGFIVIRDTRAGVAHGAQWSIVWPAGPQPYPEAWKPCPGAEGWLAYVEDVARRIGGYGADGIFLDSQGFQKDWKCLSREHGHPPGDPDVFNNGCANLIRRVRSGLRQGNPDGIVFIEGPTLVRLFEQAEGSMEWGIDTLVRRWLWDDQGKTDTLTSSYSLDDWNQVLAIGAKLACGSQFLKAPPEASAQAFLETFLSKALPDKPVDLQHVAQHASWGLHAWRNGGLIRGVRVPGLDDFLPRNWEQMEHLTGAFAALHSTRDKLRAALEAQRPRAAAIDQALAGQAAPSPVAYVKALLSARAALAPIIDHGSTVESVRTPFVKAAGWRFSSSRGTALTAVNVADDARDVAFTNAAGAWQDEVAGETFTAQGGTLTVPVPAHRVRLLRSAQARGRADTR
jgi:hypothetical protein